MFPLKKREKQRIEFVNKVHELPILFISVFRLSPLTELWPQTDNCFTFDPVGDRSFIYGTWAGGCSDDGTFFYGEKCGGSDFGDWAEAAYGQCSQPEEYCHCIGTVETQTSGCFAIATIIPPPGIQNAVFLQVDGCLLIEPEPTTEIKETEQPIGILWSLLLKFNINFD